MRSEADDAVCIHHRPSKSRRAANGVSEAARRGACVFDAGQSTASVSI